MRKGRILRPTSTDELGNFNFENNKSPTKFFSIETQKNPMLFSFSPHVRYIQTKFEYIFHHIGLFLETLFNVSPNL